MADDVYVEELLGDLHGHTVDQGQLTWLTQPLSDSDTTMTVNDGDQVFRGIAEVGEELVFVATVDTNSENVELAPFGRGYMATTKLAWPENTRVTFSPRFPRARIRKAINETIAATYPQLFAVDVFEISSPDNIKVTHALPVGAEDVLNIKQKTIGTSEFWRTLERYSVRRDGTTTEINILEGVEVGAPIRITYTKKPTRLNPGDEFIDSGLADTAWDAVKFGAMFRLISVQEAGRSASESVEASEAQQSRKQSPTSLARQYYAAHQQLMLEERMRLLSEYEIVGNQEYI